MFEKSDSTPLASIQQNSNVLILGPPLTGKYELLLRILSQHTSKVILITTKNQAKKIIEDYQSFEKDIAIENIGVIDCIRHNQVLEERKETDTIKLAGSPENLTRIGVKFTELFEVFYDEGETNVGVGIHSLSPLIMHAGTKPVYQFLQVLMGQIRSAEWLGVATMDASVVDEQDSLTIQHHFDGVIETRENDDGKRAFRVRGFTPQSSDWITF